MEEEPVIVKETTWNNSCEESKALAEEAVSTWFTGLTGHLQQRDERAVLGDVAKSKGKTLCCMSL